MSWKYLGEVFDIHGGGVDLVFPHHENEIAQSCSAFGHDVMANYWIHNGYLQVEGQKMAKSLGNFVTIHELLHRKKFGGRSWPGEVLRLAILKTHYRQPLDFTVRLLEEAEKTLNRWYALIENIAAEDSAKPRDDFNEALYDDLNTPAAVAKLHTLFSSSGLSELQAGVSELGWDVHNPLCASVAIASARCMGLMNEDPRTWKERRKTATNIDELQVKERISARLKARAARNWAEADLIRDELAAMGVALKDNKDGSTTWEPKR
jgi:cysteinyl-tRNA synthetase